MKETGLDEAKTKPAALAGLEAANEPFLLTRHDKVLTEAHSWQSSIAPKRGCLKSAGFYIAPDFDASEPSM